MDRILIKCGKLFDGIVDELQCKMQILISGRRIEAVGKNLVPSGPVRVVDLTTLTVTPGLIDAHIHTGSMDYRMDGFSRLNTSENWNTLASLHTAQETLKSGFTTIREPGNRWKYGSIDVKKAIEMGYFKGSRMVVAQHLGTTGSHGDFSQSLSGNIQLSEAMQELAACIGDGPEYFRREVRRQKKYGCDFIKIMATGGFASENSSPIEQHLSDDELEIIIKTSHELGLSVTAHAYAPELITKLVGMGIDGIEHGALLDRRTARLMEEHDVYLVPTFFAYDDVMGGKKEDLEQKPEHMRIKLLKYRDWLLESREIIIDSKIRLGYGTDIISGMPNYRSGFEYKAMLQSGMDPFRALRSATSVNASILGFSDIGQIKHGFLADIAGWDGDVSANPEALLHCCFVMKEGEIMV